MNNPFGDLIDLRIEEQRAGFSRLAITLAAHHLNPHHVVHGAVLYAMADTGMGAALYPTLAAGEICATIEIKINYFKAISAGAVVCTTEMLSRGKRVANLESRLFLGEVLIAQANGNYAIFGAKKAAP